MKVLNALRSSKCVKSLSKQFVTFSKYLRNIKFSSHFKDSILSLSQVVLNIYLYNNNSYDNFIVSYQ